MDEDPEFETAVRDLGDTLEALRAELRDPPRGPLGLPRPPTPRELLRFTEAYTIPTIVAILETNIRLLELLAAVIRVADGRPLDAAAREEGLFDVGRRTIGEAGRVGADGLAAASRTTLERLDDALAELQDAAEGGAPDDPEVQRLLAEARDLRAEVDERLAAATTAEDTRPADAASDADAEEPEGSPIHGRDAGEPVAIDVEEELNTLRRQADRPTDDASAPDDGDEDTEPSDGTDDPSASDGDEDDAGPS